jgi:hypothetical protein
VAPTSVGHHDRPQDLIVREGDHLDKISRGRRAPLGRRRGASARLGPVADNVHPGSLNACGRIRRNRASLHSSRSDDPPPPLPHDPHQGRGKCGQYDSGLLAAILPTFTKEAAITVHVLAQGTGQALATAARDDADLILVHDPEAEERFIADGHGIERAQIAWNDFVVVGRDPTRRMSQAGMMRSKAFVRSPLPALRLCRGGTRAAPMRNLAGPALGGC